MKVFLLLYGGWVLERMYTGYFSSLVTEGAKTKLVCFFKLCIRSDKKTKRSGKRVTKEQKGVEQIRVLQPLQDVLSFLCIEKYRVTRHLFRRILIVCKSTPCGES